MQGARKMTLLGLLAMLLAVALLPTRTQSFAPSSFRSRSVLQRNVCTQLQERRWNFNDGQGPFGMKKNAEIWNGRVAQVAFVVVFAQELVTGKGVVQSWQEGNVLGVAAAAIGTLGLTAWLAIQGKDSYVDRELGRK